MPALKQLSGLSVNFERWAGRRKGYVLDYSGALARVTGDFELSKKLAALPGKIQKKVVKQAINYGLSPAVKAARRKAPVRFGFLRNSVKKKVGKSGLWGKVYVDPAVKVIIRGRWHKPSKIAHLQELKNRRAKSLHPFLLSSIRDNRNAVNARITSKARQLMARFRP